MVDRLGYRPVGEVPLEGLVAVEPLHTEALAALVVLGEQRQPQSASLFHATLAADHGDRARHVEAGGAQSGVLVDLAHLELKHAASVDHTAAVAFQPGEQRAGVLLGAHVPAGVARRAHA